MSPAIHVSNLSKVYKHYWGPRALLRELIFGTPAHYPLWALKDISFDVPEGEAFGVIGPNGAGKTTLLKILTGTAFPSAGSARVNGRVSALLELGAGFHPDFSGRENIYFNGALLGYSRDEIKEREQAIIDFSELEEFIDRPVKTYSSGMYVRLGFAVATGFDPRILIIDEALAVGDQSFQKKCTDRIINFKKEGRTIVFCSHNLYQVNTLCDRAMWLNRGQCEALGPADDVVGRYTDFVRGAPDREELGKKSAPKERELCWIKEVKLLNSSGDPQNEFQTGDTLQLRITAHFARAYAGTPGIGVSLVRNDGVLLYTTTNTMEGVTLNPSAPEEYACRLIYKDIPLLPGTYYFNVVTTDEDNIQAYDIVEKAAIFTVHYDGSDFGLVKLPHCFKTD